MLRNRTTQKICAENTDVCDGANSCEVLCLCTVGGKRRKRGSEAQRDQQSQAGHEMHISTSFNRHFSGALTRTILVVMDLGPNYQSINFVSTCAHVDVLVYKCCRQFGA